MHTSCYMYVNFCYFRSLVFFVLLVFYFCFWSSLLMLEIAALWSHRNTVLVGIAKIVNLYIIIYFPPFSFDLLLFSPLCKSFEAVSVPVAKF